MSRELSDELRGDLRRIIRLHKLLPNLLTLMALAAGMSAIQFAVRGMWEQAAFAVVVAAVLDSLDGATARLIKASSDFGAQLDSLSDFLSFGVAPAFILYIWVLDDAGKVGWIAVLVFAIATALRLARFNVMQAHAYTRPVWARGFFAGVPAPAGAGLALTPLFIWNQSEDWSPVHDFFSDFSSGTPLIALWTIAVAGLMVSRIPTFSTKQLRIPARLAMPVLGLAALGIAAMIHAPWITLTCASIAYIGSIPFSFRAYRRLEAAHHDHPDAAEPLADLALGVVTLDHVTESEGHESDRH
ncbi:MAG TPA: phosphatidylcholine/phosphatidylserine synthase [Alphaproteobacteria bacterium]|nr:phosphatidylcholine/phosphatidylserine synthase [Alphaproteobacteria bacterium]